MKDLVAVVIGALFALGLGLAGMTDANKVIGFLDVSSGWDPSLAVVMIGGIGVHLASWKIATSGDQPFFGGTFRIPTRSDIDFRLIGGAALFGMGWGLGGFCPGPGIVSGTTGALPVLVFLGGMTLGMLAWAAVPSPETANPSLKITEPNP